MVFNMKQISIDFLEVTGNRKKTARVNFSNGLNVIYGASNTGKSYVLKLLDFMLGADKLTKKIKEAKGYERIAMGITLKDSKSYIVERLIKGGDYYLREVDSSPEKLDLILKPSHTEEESLSNFLLEYLGWDSRKLARNQSGELQSLTLRNLAFLSLTDEGHIQSEMSPMLTSNYSANTAEKSFFRFLLSYVDDSNIMAVVDDKTFKVNKETSVRIYSEILKEINNKLQDCTGEDDIKIQLEKLDSYMENSYKETNRLKENINSLFNFKKKKLMELAEIENFIFQSNVHKKRFETLDEIYDSDISRLKFIEEVGSLSILNPIETCASCGSEISKDKVEINSDLISYNIKSSVAEINKIRRLKEDLYLAVHDVKIELEMKQSDQKEVNSNLIEIDKTINDISKDLEIHQKDIKKYIFQRDILKDYLDGFEQKRKYIKKLNAVEGRKKPTKDEKPNLDLSDEILTDFTNVVSDVLKKWKFPGKHMVKFDSKSFDILIDDEERISNGKGVRAITHAAFKVAIVLYCHKKNIPHPNFLVLDTPLLAYRDPISHRAGGLEAGELELQKNSVKEAFFKHLESISKICQFIILENIDPPDYLNDSKEVNIIQFSGNYNQGRQGFFSG